MVEVTKEFIEDVKALRNYLEEYEDTHFWENCCCEGSEDFDGDVSRCSCEENKDHIWRVIKRLEVYLDEVKR